MPFDKSRAAGRLGEAARTVFRDFITNRPAGNEIEFSAALAVLHNWHRINWSGVQLQPASESVLDARVTADALVDSNAVALCEYPLFSAPQSIEEGKWGGYRADILFVSADRKNVVYIENKIGARASENIIARTIECLDNSHFLKKASFILVTGREFADAGWYVGELKRALMIIGTGRKSVSAHVMFWEDIVKACAVP